MTSHTNTEDCMDITSNVASTQHEQRLPLEVTGFEHKTCKTCALLEDGNKKSFATHVDYTTPAIPGSGLGLCTVPGTQSWTRCSSLTQHCGLKETICFTNQKVIQPSSTNSKCFLAFCKLTVRYSPEAVSRKTFIYLFELRISRATAPEKKKKKITPSVARFIHKAFSPINSIHQEKLPNK